MPSVAFIYVMLNVVALSNKCHLCIVNVLISESLVNFRQFLDAQLEVFIQLMTRLYNLGAEVHQGPML
jgi:hypothetical protein